MKRRDFLKCTAGATAVSLSATASATVAPHPDREFISVLVDTTRCIGCRSCEVACATEHGLPVPDRHDTSVFYSRRDTEPDSWTVVNRFTTDGGDVFVKKQCMHCNQAACSTACLTQAMYKTVDGPVIWRSDKCMGCRFCMVSCPYDIPRFEYDSANPKIQKCILCDVRLADGGLPACVESCPVDALQFGTRREMVRIAQNRIDEHPFQYVDHIYGEHEVGGSGWIYLAGVPFDQLGFRTDLSQRPVPELTQSFLYSVPVIFLLWPAFLNALRHVDDDTDQPPLEGEQDQGGAS